MEAMFQLQGVQFMKKYGLHGSNSPATGCSILEVIWVSWKRWSRYRLFSS
jgi:hypothetical protein